MSFYIALCTYCDDVYRCKRDRNGWFCGHCFHAFRFAS